MRRALGGLVLVAGVGGLGWYGTGNQARDMEAAIAAVAADIAGTSQHGTQVAVSGRDIVLTGLSDDGAETARLTDALNAITGRRTVDVSGLTELEIVSPYEFGVMQEDGFTRVGGSVPSQALMDVLKQRSDDASLTLANGEPDAGWDAAAVTIVAAAKTLKLGTVTMSGTEVTTLGVVALPDDLAAYNAAMADLPEGYTLTSDITVEDDGTPLRLNLAYDGDVITGDGKLPSELTVDDIQVAGANADVAVVQAVIPSAQPAWPDTAKAGVAALGALRSGTLAIDGTAVTLSGIGSPAEIAAAQAALDGVQPPFTTDFAPEIYDDGAPLSLTLSSDGTNVIGQGKLPAGMAVTDVAVAGKATLLDATVSFLPSADGNWAGVAQSGLSALGALSSGELAIVDRDISLSGTGTPDAVNAIESLFAALPDGYTATTDLTLFDDGTPFSLNVSAAGTASGKVPADFADVISADILPQEARANLSTAFITDETGTWPAIAQAGLAALAQVDGGTLAIADGKISLTGTAANPAAAAALADALGDYDATFDLILLDDGAPASLDLVYSATDGADVSGKLPAGVTADDIAAALGLDAVSGTPKLSDVTSDADLLGPLATLAGVLPEVDALTYSAGQDGAALDVTTAPGVNAELIAATLTETLANVDEISVSEQADLPAQGEVRLNRFTNRRERFTSGNWLPILNFRASLDACQAETDKALSESDVNFLSGSAQLDAQSIRAINLIAAITRKCALEAGVSLNVDGHTDSTGNADSNLALSQARADAVRTALLARGIGGVVITATGYGADAPIADNTTEEGKAANRRTEFNWIE